MGLFVFSFVNYLRPARLNALYNHVLSSMTRYEELKGYCVEDEYNWGVNSFSVVLSNNSVKDKVIVVDTNILSQIMGIHIDSLTDNSSFVTINDEGIKDSIKLFNSIFLYSNISDSYISEIGSQLVNFISSEALNDIDLDVVGKNLIIDYKANLKALYDYNKATLKKDVFLEELTSYDVFCDRLLSHDYYYYINDKCIVLNIAFDYKVNHEHIKIYFKDGVISCE